MSWTPSSIFYHFTLFERSKGPEFKFRQGQLSHSSIVVDKMSSATCGGNRESLLRTNPPNGDLELYSLAQAYCKGMSSSVLWLLALQCIKPLLYLTLFEWKVCVCCSLPGSVTHEVASYLVQQYVGQCSDVIFDSAWEVLFCCHVVEMSRHRVANFIFQKILSRVHTQSQVSLL